MSERDDLIQEIDELRARKEFFAHEAMLVERGYGAVRKVHPKLASSAEEYPQTDGLDEWHDRTSADLGRLHARLHEIEASISRREFLADAAYGRSL